MLLFTLSFEINFTMRIAACGDIHAPKFLDLFAESLPSLGRVDLFILAGDVVLKNDFTQLTHVVRRIREVYGGRIVACFGNEEYEQNKPEYLKFQEITWLDDEAMTIEAEGKRVGIVGSRGSLDRPTFWQRRNIPGIWRRYRERVTKMDSLLADLAADVTVVVTHYAPTYRTLIGERESAWPEMGCRRMEEVILRRRPDYWLHAHAHRSTSLVVRIGETLVMNVSLPAVGKVTVFDI